MSDAFPTGAPIWPFDVDWSDAYRVTYSFKTTISTTRSGVEQRRALRRTPRKSVEFSVLLSNGGVNTFRRLMAARQSLPMVLPEITRGAPLVSVAGASVTVAPAPWQQPGARVLLIDGERRELFAVATAAGGVLSLPGLTSAWSPRTIVYPALAAYLRSPAVQLLTKGVAQVPVKFDVIPGSSAVQETGSSSESFDGRPLFTPTANWADGVDETFTWPSTRLDYMRGRAAVFHPVEFGSRTRSAAFVQRNRSDAEALVAFFMEQRGRRGDFYGSTWGDDLPMAATAASGATTIVVAGADVTPAFDGEVVHRAIEIRLRNGTVLRRRITDIAPNGNSSVLSFVTPLPFAIAPDDVLAISWLLIWRFASDDLILEWVTDAIAQTQIAMTTLPNFDHLFEGALRSIPQGDDRSIAPTGDDRGVAG